MFINQGEAEVTLVMCTLMQLKTRKWHMQHFF